MSAWSPATASARRKTGARYRQRTCERCGKKSNALHKVNHTPACIRAHAETYRQVGHIEGYAELMRQSAVGFRDKARVFLGPVAIERRRVGR